MTLTEFLKLHGWTDKIYRQLAPSEKRICYDAIINNVGLTNHPKAIYAWQLALSCMRRDDSVGALVILMMNIAYLMLDKPVDV